MWPRPYNRDSPTTLLRPACRQYYNNGLRLHTHTPTPRLLLTICSQLPQPDYPIQHPFSPNLPKPSSDAVFACVRACVSANLVGLRSVSPFWVVRAAACSTARWCGGHQQQQQQQRAAGGETCVCCGGEEAAPRALLSSCCRCCTAHAAPRWTVLVPTARLDVESP